MNTKQKVQDVCWKCGMMYPHTTPEAKTFHYETVTALKKVLPPGHALIPGNTYRELDAHEKRQREMEYAIDKKPFRVHWCHTGKFEADYIVLAHSQEEADNYVSEHHLVLDPENITPLSDDYEQFL